LRPGGHGPPTACRQTVSGPVSLPSQGCFSPFPHGTGSLSVIREYLALGEGPPGFPQGFSCPAVLRMPLWESGRFRLQGCHLLGPGFPTGSARGRIVDSTACGPATPERVEAFRFRLFPVRSPLLGKSRLFSLPPGTEMVHFPGWALAPLSLQGAVSPVCGEGLPHWEIPGSKPVCGSPGLIAADHVLPRLLMPRHPLSALSSLTIQLIRSIELAMSAMIAFSCQRTVRLTAFSGLSATGLQPCG
jgi:hypothetical protein